MEPSKISFSFTKSFKKSNIILNTNTPKENEKKGEIIECLEEQSIKIKDAVIEEAQPLVIPLKDDQKNLLDRIKAAKKWDKKKEKEDTRPDSELTAEELAARQLIREAKARLENGHESNNHKVSVLPLTEESTSLTGEKEPTLEDYESVPIGDYGLALLRGMGWKDGMAIGKNVTKSAALSIPELRPKGLGLGATKVILSEKKATDKDGNELILMKRGFAKAVMGPQNGNYCEIQGFDDEAGRVIVKVYPKGDIININEVMLVPVTKEEFSKGSKILNNAKYEQYKKLSDKKLESFKVKKEKSDYEDSDGLSKDATCSRYPKRSPSFEGEFDTSKYSQESRQSRSRSKDEESKKSRSYIDMDQSKKGTKKTGSRSNHWLESDRTESRSRSKDRRSRKKYRSKSRSWSKDKKKDEDERTSRSRSDKDRQKSRSMSEDSYQERKKSRSRSNKDQRKSSKDASDEDKRDSRSRSKKSRNKSKDKISRHSSKHKSSKNRSGSIEKAYSKEKKKKKSSHKSKKDGHSAEDSDRSRSTSKDKQVKNRKSRETSYSSDSDLKKEKRRKNKCKSRHRQASSSDSEDRKYRKKK